MNAVTQTQGGAVAAIGLTELPARLRTAEAQAAAVKVAAELLAGLGGASFPYISKKGSKFTVVNGDERIPLMDAPTEPGLPALPKALLQIVVVGWNAGKSKAYYAGKYEEGERKAPDCSSSDGIVPDSNIAQPQHNACATCEKNKWGSKTSEFSGKESKACGDMKQLAVVPAKDLNYMALGMALTPADFDSWKTYGKDLAARGASVNDVITLVKFDNQAAHPKYEFMFGGYLNDEAAELVAGRMTGADVDAIIKPLRAPRAVDALPAPAAGTPTAPAVPLAPTTPPVTHAGPPAGTVAGATTAQEQLAASVGIVTPPGAAVSQPVASKRAGRPKRDAPTDAAAAAPTSSTDPFAGLAPHVKQACSTMAEGSPEFLATYAALAGKPYPAPAAPVVVDPFEGQPPHVKQAVDSVPVAAKGATYKALTGKDWPGAASPTPAAVVAAATVPVTPVAAAAPRPAVQPVVPPVSPPPVATTPGGGLSVAERLAAQIAKSSAAANAL